MNTKNHRGKFIVFEGLDGSGITTQAQILYQYLKKENLPVISTSEPTQGPMGLLLRLALSHRLSLSARTPETEYLATSSIALLFAADRLDHMQHILLPRLGEGMTVICERYYLSSYAYQMGQDYKNLEWLKIINSKCIPPDLIIYLNTNTALCEKRRIKRGTNQELYEKTELLRLVARNYDYAIAQLRNEIAIEIVDGSPSEEIVFAQILKVIRQHFPEMLPYELASDTQECLESEKHKS